MIAQSPNDAQQLVNDANADGEQNPKPDLPGVYRGIFNQLFLPIELQGSYWAAVNGVLQNASVAYRIDRTLQRYMRLDPALMAPLTSIEMAYATAPVKIIPKDRKNELEVQIAAWVTDRLEAIPYWTDYRMTMADGIWWGRSAVLNRYERRGNATLVESWTPIHPDTLCCNYQGRIGLKVGPKYTAQPSIITSGPESIVHMLNAEEREAVVLARYRPQGPDYWDGMSTEYAYLGQGLRDLCWFVWKLKQHVLQCWGVYAQRYAMGIRKAFYRAGNDDAMGRMTTAAANTMGDSTLLIPDDGQTARRVNDLEVNEPSSATADTFYSLLVRLESKLKEMIEGQSASSEGVSTGLGSSVGTEHARTKADHVDYIAAVADECMTRDLIGPLVRMNFGDGAPIPRMRTQVRRPDPDRYAAAVEKVVSLGGVVAQDDVYDYLGLRHPDPDEPTFRRAETPLIDLHGLRG